MGLVLLCTGAGESAADGELPGEGRTPAGGHQGRGHWGHTLAGCGHEAVQLA